MCLVPLFLLSWTAASNAQQLRFTNHRELSVPSYATFKIGPFYSTMTFSQSVAYRYTASSGRGTDYLVRNRRGVTVQDGNELPCVSMLEMRNYLLLTDYTDLDVSLRFVYEYYPLGTQENEFYFDMGQEGVVGSLTSEIIFSPFLRGRLFDSIVYRTDYVDSRGIPDRYGGQRNEYLRNVVGLDLDWLFARDKNFGVTLSRADEIPFTDTFLSRESVTYKESLTYEQLIGPGLSAGASAGFTQVRYRDVDETAVNLQTYRALLNFGRGARITRRSTVSVSAGYSVGRAWSNVETNLVDVEALVGGIALRTELTERLSHEFSYARGMTPGFFTGTLELADRYAYRIGWKTDRLSIGLSSSLGIVKPAGTEKYGEYWDWSSGVEASCTITRHVVLNGSSVYSRRDNRDDALGPVIDEELVSDYDTWISRLGTTVTLARSLFFDTYMQYVERLSDNSNLVYERFTFYAGLKYRHEF
ncbi:MAG: hypothetical protein HQ559_03440 [Lentisphaerae bacterium]|nr:hypothetical protein [Lentisphaerota bacterium]